MRAVFDAIMCCMTGFVLPADTASNDSGVSAIAEAVCHGLDKQPLDTDHVDPVFLLVVCHLINSDMIGKSCSSSVTYGLFTL